MDYWLNIAQSRSATVWQHASRPTETNTIRQIQCNETFSLTFAALQEYGISASHGTLRTLGSNRSCGPVGPEEPANPRLTRVLDSKRTSGRHRHYRRPRRAMDGRRSTGMGAAGRSPNRTRRCHQLRRAGLGRWIVNVSDRFSGIPAF